MAISVSTTDRGPQLLAAGIGQAGDAIFRGFLAAEDRRQQEVSKTEQLDFLGSQMQFLSQQDGIITPETLERFETGSLGNKQAIVMEAQAKFDRAIREEEATQRQMRSIELNEIAAERAQARRDKQSAKEDAQLMEQVRYFADQSFSGGAINGAQFAQVDTAPTPQIAAEMLQRFEAINQAPVVDSANPFLVQKLEDGSVIPYQMTEDGPKPVSSGSIIRPTKKGSSSGSSGGDEDDELQQLLNAASQGRAEEKQGDAPQQKSREPETRDDFIFSSGP